MWQTFRSSLIANSQVRKPTSFRFASSNSAIRVFKSSKRPGLTSSSITQYTFSFIKSFLKHPEANNSLSRIIWAGHHRSNRHPKFTETKASLCGLPEALLKSSVPQNQQVRSFDYLTGINCETQADDRGR